MNKKKELDAGKISAFIKEEAIEVPETTRVGAELQIPERIAKALESQVMKNDGSFAIDLAKFNRFFGWKETSPRSLYLQSKLNKQYPRPEGQSWHVGSIQNNTLYKFEFVPSKTEENKVEEEGN